MAQQRGQEIDHRARHAGHLNQQSEEDKQWHRQQNQVRHALIEPTDKQQHRHVGGEHHVGEGADCKCNGDWHTGKHRRADESDEEQDQVQISEALQPRLCHRSEQCRRRCQADQQERNAEREGTEQPDDADDDHQGKSTRQWHRQPGLGDSQTWDFDPGHFLHVFDGGLDHRGQEQQARRRCKRFEALSRSRWRPDDERRHAHMLASVQRHSRADHAEPEKHGLREIVCPYQR